jgi:PAS domain S-box-containing protein
MERFRSEQKYKQLVECTNAAIYEIDFVNQRFTYVNDKICEFTGYARDELLSMSPFDILTDESKQLFAKRLRKLHRGEFIPNTAEFQVKTKEGRKKWVLITTDYISKGDAVVGARVVAIDITKARKKQMIIESIYRTAPVALGTLEYAGGERRLLQVNQTMCDILGYGSEELIGKSARMLYPSQSEFDRVGRLKYDDKIFKGKIGTVETEWVTKDGKIRNIILSTSSIDLGEPEGCHAFTAMDITEKKELEHELDSIISEKITNWRQEIELPNQVSALESIINGTYKHG